MKIAMNGFDVAKSTRAAARYLSDLHNAYQSWPLALAAYNTGEQNLNRAIARSGSMDFAGLANWLAPETRSYVPTVLQYIRSGALAQAQPQPKGRAIYAGWSAALPEIETKEREQ